MSHGEDHSPLGRVIARLRDPLLLYGLGSVLVLGVLLTGVVTDADPLLVGAAVLLLLAALGAATVVRLRRDRNARRGFTTEVIGENVRASDDGLVASQDAPGVTGPFAPKINASGDVVAEGRGAIGSQRSETGADSTGPERTRRGGRRRG